MLTDKKKIATACLSLLAGIIFLSFTLQNPAEKDCREMYNRIVEFYNEYKEGPVYMKFTSQTIQDNETGMKVVNEAWVDKESALFKNEMLSIYNKKLQQAFVMHSTKKIILKKVKESQPASVPQINYSYDTLKKYAIEIKCNKQTNMFAISLPEKIGKTKNSISRIVYYLDSEGKQLKKMELDYYGEVKRTDKYEYLRVSHSVTNSFLSQSLEEFIYTADNTLKPEFKGYDVQDQRTTDFLKNKK